MRSEEEDAYKEQEFRTVNSGHGCPLHSGQGAWFRGGAWGLRMG